MKLLLGPLRVSLACACCLAAAAAQQASPPTPPPTSPAIPRMSFEFSNPALTPAAWRIEFDGSGLGRYHSQPGDASAPDANGAMSEAFDQQIQVSAPLRGQLFGFARSHHFFSYRCESPQHNVAFTGHKTVTYSGPDGQGSCTFNWSPDSRLMKLTSSFLGISMTLEEGRKLRLEYLHDRLSLDSELETLADAVKNGNALELENIAPELQAIASDPAIMKRAQQRAAALLATAP